MNKVIKHKKVIVIAGIILSILFGIFIFYKLSNNNLNYIVNHSNQLSYMSYKTIILHFLLLTTSLVFSFLGIGIILLIIYLFFEGVIIGFMSSYFIYLYKISGIFYAGVYILIYKFLLIFLMIILSLKYIKIFKALIKYVKKEKIDITKTIINSLIVIGVIIINDITLLYFGDNLLNSFSFIIN